MSDPLLVLPVHQPAAGFLVRGKTRQLSRNFAPPDESLIGRWIAIQATAYSAERKRLGLLPDPEWAILGVGKLTGAGYYPGFCRDPKTHMGRSYKREKGQAGAWVWTFSNVVKLDKSVPLDRLEPVQWRGAEAPSHREDDGSGDWWGTCPRKLESSIVESVREAHRKAKART